MGRYDLRVTWNDNEFLLERVLVLFPLALPAQEYEALRSFFDEVRRADRAQLTFTREEQAR
jgi:hypothetical protein